MLAAGDIVPLFEVVAVDGRTVAYRDVWQRRPLLLVSLKGGDGTRVPVYLDALGAQAAGLALHGTAVVVTREHVDGVDGPGVVVADRWGEVQFATRARPDLSDMPPPDTLIEWLRFVQYQCPECQGEAR
jgi:hypothetical protein